MHPKREVDIQSPGLAEHHPGARGGPLKACDPGSLDPSYASTSVRRTVTPACETVHPKKLGCHLQNWPGKEGARQSALRHVVLPRHTLLTSGAVGHSFQASRCRRFQ